MSITFDEYRDLYVYRPICVHICNPSSHPPLAASRQQSHLYKAGRGKGQEHEVRGDHPDPMNVAEMAPHFSNQFFFANGCNSGMGKDVNDGQQRQILVGNKMYRR